MFAMHDIANLDLTAPILSVIFSPFALLLAPRMYRAWRLYRWRRRVMKMPVTPIAKVSEGAIVKICGQIELVGQQEPLEAPLSGRRVVAFAASVEIVEERSAGPPVITPYRRQAEAEDVTVRDATGSALVRAHRVQLIGRRNAPITPTADRQQRWLRANRGRERFLFKRRELRYNEATLAPGDAVVVLGHCVERRGADGGPYRGAAETNIVIEAPARDWAIIYWDE
jgi:hypothetical protein